MASYTRQSSFADGDTITAALFNNEFNQVVNAFHNSTGHKHDGTAAEGPVIGVLGDAGETSPNNKVLIDTTNNFIEFYVQVSSSPVQQLYIADGAIIPVTDNDIDLGTSSLEFKNAYFDGTVTSDAFAGPLTGDVTGNVSGTAATVTTAAQSNITSLGTLTTLTVDNVIINGTTIGHTSDTDLLTLTSGVLTVAGEVDATSLDISGDADIDGTLEADAITIGGVTLSETIADTVGAMVTSNTESGVTVVYQDLDNTIDFTVGTLNQDTTGLAATATALATARTIGGTSFDGTANIAVATATEGTNVTVSANNSTDETVYPTFVDGATGTQGIETDTGLTYNPSTGMLTTTGVTSTFTGNITGNVTGNTSGTAATVTTAAQSNITSLGTLTALTVDNLGVNGNTITANSGALNLTPAAGSAIVLDGTINVDAGVVTGATSVTSTAFVGGLTGNVTGNTSGTAATVTTAAQTNITSLGTLTALTVDDVAVDGKIITMTGSASDTAVLTAGTNGTLSIVTTDAAAAAANIQITADGTVDIDSAGVLTLDSGAAINIEPATGSAILLDGTISIDAGVVTGATSITSTAFAGALTGNVTGNASGTAATVTGGTQAAITSTANLVTVGTIGTGVWQGTAIASGYIAADAITGAKIADDAINSEHYTDGSIDTAHIADNQITLAKMAGGTDGNIISYDASGDPVAIATGTDGQVLTSTGAGSPPAFEDAASGGASAIDGLSDAKTFGTSSLMLGDATTGTIDAADYNTGVGVDVFAALTSGDYNSVLGFSAGNDITTGHSNTIMGADAGAKITTGAYNVAIGRASLDACTTADSNTAVGWTSLGLTTTGAGNTAVGSDAGAAITTGANNVIMGYLAGDALTTGESSTFIGKSAGSSLTTSADNIAIGFGALDAANSASTSQCIVIGVDAAGGALAGYNNVFIGYTSALAATSAFENTSVGGKSLKALTTGDYNVCLGFEAGDAITSGSNNIIVGYQAGKSGSPGGAITTASNILSLGDENIATANIQVDWTVASDKRDKTDVESLNMGLDFINKLEPITYRWDKRSKYSDDQSVTPDGAHKEEQLDVGFLAQDVEALEKEYGYDFDNKTNLTTQLSEDNQMYGLKYSKFVPMLVKSIQELTTQVEMLKTEVATLKGE